MLIPSCFSSWQAALELEGVKGLWSLRKTSAAEFDTFLVVTFVSETRILAINEEDELEEFDIPGFNAEAQTLLTANVAHDQIIQVGTISFSCRVLFMEKESD